MDSVCLSRILYPPFPFAAIDRKPYLRGVVRRYIDKRLETLDILDWQPNPSNPGSEYKNYTVEGFVSLCVPGTTEMDA